MDTPVYTAKENTPGAISVGTGTTPIPQYAGGEIGNAVAKLGEAGEQFATRMLKANAATGAMRARTKFLTGLAGLTQKYQNDPDPATAPARFTKEVQDLTADQLGTIPNQQLRSLAEFHMAVEGLQAQRQMQNLSMKRELGENTDGLKTLRPAYLKAAGGAGSAVERAAVTDDWDGAVDTLHAAGFFSSAQAGAAKQRFRSDVAQNDATALIAHDPDHAAHALNDPESFPGLDPFARAELQRQADAASDGAAWRAQAGADAAATKDFAAGRLTQDALDAAAPNMSGAAYRSLSAALKPASGAFDPQVYGDFLHRAADGESIQSPAADAYASGHLDKPAFQRILDVSDRFSSDMDNGAPWRVDQRRDLFDLLKPQPGQSPAAARSQLDAAAGFDQWLDQNQNATQDQSQAQMEGIAAQARAAAAASDRATLPIPTGVAVPRGDVDGGAIVDAATRLRDAFTNFQGGS